MFKGVINTFRIFMCVVLLVQLAGCGTILYPERKGQKSGKIDAGVAVFDGIGILLFIIPGVIGFVVDFHNGTIYLPGTSGAGGPEEGIKTTLQNVGKDLKSAGRNAAESIRQAIK